MEKLTIQEEEVMLHIWSMGDKGDKTKCDKLSYSA